MPLGSQNMNINILSINQMWLALGITIYLIRSRKLAHTMVQGIKEQSKGKKKWPVEEANFIKPCKEVCVCG